jgi:hypothetical protein
MNDVLITTNKAQNSHKASNTHCIHWNTIKIEGQNVNGKNCTYNFGGKETYIKYIFPWGFKGLNNFYLCALILAYKF